MFDKKIKYDFRSWIEIWLQTTKTLFYHVPKFRGHWEHRSKARASSPLIWPFNFLINICYQQYTTAKNEETDWSQGREGTHSLYSRYLAKTPKTLFDYLPKFRRWWEHQPKARVSIPLIWLFSFLVNIHLLPAVDYSHKGRNWMVPREGRHTFIAFKLFWKYN